MNSPPGSVTFDGGQFTIVDGRTECHVVDLAGRQSLRIDARGHRTSYSYDPDGRIVGRRYPDGSRVTFAWDAAGNRSLLADATGRHTASYDPLNRTTTVNSPPDKLLAYGYDAAGQRKVLVDPDGGRFTYGYGAAGPISRNGRSGRMRCTSKVVPQLKGISWWRKPDVHLQSGEGLAKSMKRDVQKHVVRARAYIQQALLLLEKEQALPSDGRTLTEGSMEALGQGLVDMRAALDKGDCNFPDGIFRFASDMLPLTSALLEAIAGADIEYRKATRGR